jgi:HEAT repeat protein
MRYEAALASGELMLQQAVAPLARMIKDADPQVSSACIWALGQIRGSRAKQALLEAYEDADAHLREAIEEALAEHALLEGDLDFSLYAFNEDPDEAMLDDDLYVLWSADDENSSQPDLDNEGFDER